MRLSYGKRAPSARITAHSCGIDVVHAAHEHSHISLIAKNRTVGVRRYRPATGRPWLPDRARLEEMVVLAIDQGDGDSRFTQPFSGIEAAKSAANQHNTMLIFAWVFSLRNIVGSSFGSVASKSTSGPVRRLSLTAPPHYRYGNRVRRMRCSDCSVFHNNCLIESGCG